MLRLTMLVLGVAMILVGLISRFSLIQLPVDLKAIPITFISVSYTLESVLLVGGLFLLLIAWVFHKLAQ